MKICLFFLLISVATVTANVSYSQSTKLTLDLQNATMKELIQEIEGQSEFIFVFYDNALNLEQKVSIRASDQPIEKILEKVLESTGNTYAIFDRQIVIGKKNPETGKISMPVETLTDAEQRKEITGKVTDAQKLPLPGVSIVIKGTTQGTITDENGNFRLTYTGEAKILSFSFVGMKTQEVTVGNETSFSIIMEDETVGVDEVVVVGYGTQKKVSVTGAISAVKSDDILKSPTMSVANTLAGKVSGLMSIQSSGQPGADDATLYVRGVSSLTTGSSAPLVLVDGVPREFGRLDPNEIESISILKDASATAVFGVRGANGVIVVTTKRGFESKPMVSISSSFGFQKPTNKLDFVDSYTFALRHNEARVNDGQTPMFSNEAIEAFRTNSDPIIYPNIDWVDYMLRDISSQSQHNINIRGGNEIAKYFISLGYRTQDGLFKKFYKFDDSYWYDQRNLRANMDLKLSKTTDFSVTVGGRSGIRNEPLRSGVTQNDVWGRLYWGQPFGSPGFINGPYGDDMWVITGNQLPFNKKTGLDENGGIGIRKQNDNVLNLDAEIKQKLDYFIKGLQFKAKASYNGSYSMVKSRSFSKARYLVFPKYMLDPAAVGDKSPVYRKVGSDGLLGYTESLGRTREWYFETGLNYDQIFGSHNITGLLLYTASKIFYPSTYADIPRGYVGIVGRATYDFKEKYLLDLNIGYNGSENFAKGNRFGFFPAVSIGWVVSNEKFLKSIPVIEYLKVRGSFGIVGNDQIGGNRFLYLPDSYISSSGSYNFGIDVPENQIAAIEGTLGNPFVTWEKSEKSNIGFDLKLFKGKLGITMDGFYEYRHDILTSRKTTPSIVSVTLPSLNIGKVENKGFEVELTWRQSKPKFGYYASLNFSFARNTILFMDEITPAEDYLARTGRPVSQMFGYVSDGFWSVEDIANISNFPVHKNFTPKPGDMRFKDLNDDDMVNSLDQKAIGYPEYPEINGSLNFGANYKNFDISCSWVGATHTSRNFDGAFRYGFNRWGDWNMMQWIADGRWTPETASTATYPRLTLLGGIDGGYNMVPSDFFLFDASYLRLKNLEFGYTFSNLSLAGISSLRLYFNGADLLSFSKIKITDPESAASDTPSHPRMNVFNFGLTASFK